MNHRFLRRLSVRSVLAFAIVLLANTARSSPIFDPGDFASLGALPGGSFSIDTDANILGGVVVGQGGALLTNTPQDSGGGDISFFAPPEILVLTFDGGSELAAGDVIMVTGTRSLAMLFQGAFNLNGTIRIRGYDGGDATTLAGSRGTGGAGGYSGGVGSGACSGDQPGAGPGGGGDGKDAAGNTDDSGGGGGGHGGAGGAGTSNRLGMGAPGAANGDLTQALQGGSGGGGGAGECGPLFIPGGGGGGGGGGLEIGALTLLNVDGTVDAGGGDGGVGHRSGGGGAGGGVRLHAFSIGFTGLVDATGGEGPANGGCGGGGRVLFVNNDAGDFANNGTVDVSPGEMFCSSDGSVLALTAPDVGTDPDAGTGPLPTPVPEPTSILLFATGVLSILVRRRRLKPRIRSNTRAWRGGW